MVYSNTVCTPVDTNGKLSANHGVPYSDPTKFRSLAECHMNALNRIVQYIKDTVDHGLHLTKSSIRNLVSCTNVDWGGFPDTRRSTSGYCVFLGTNLISRSSKRQPTVSRSSVEAEYLVLQTLSRKLLVAKFNVVATLSNY
ncbi:uncharacterized mitochondrial protein AtMg00810-like [Rutidosis leptorrhynchoides]|uniref:uncharacterized mitochondrial protein AtMg00810-like n=1 Tax=Rutidosis leptorrhynchoides TaxID=125765 RepID=UPI003A996AEF